MRAPDCSENAVEDVRTMLLDCLADGRARTAIELAREAGCSRSEVALQLGNLVAAGVVRIAAEGRHTYYALATDAGTPVRARSTEFKPSTPASLRTARTCYGHLAGAMGVALCDRMLAQGWLVTTEEDPVAYRVTHKGAAALARIRIDTAALRPGRRGIAHACLDWSERRPHLGGALGVAVCEAAVRRRWITRVAGSRRVKLTAAGRRSFEAWLGATF